MPTENKTVARSMMAHGSMLWGAALYNNGGYPLKDARFGESYSEDGNPQVLFQVPQPTREEQMFKGHLSLIEPIPRWEISQPGNILRVFERGGKRRLEIGLPDREEEGGKPDKGLSPRGLGTNNRTDPVYLGLQKTRLLDPTLNFLGTNDHPGDYRSAGCTACHVVYANDRDPAAAGLYAKAGNQGHSQSADTSIPKNEPGHPIKHQFTLADTDAAVHDLPHAPGNKYGRDLSRANVVGQRIGRQGDVPGQRADRPEPGGGGQETRPQPGGRLFKRPLVRTGYFFKRQARPNLTRG